MSDCPGSQTLVSARQEKIIPLAINGDHNAAGMMKSVWSCTPTLQLTATYVTVFEFLLVAKYSLF